uniref:ribosomal protein S13 n=1 Tax=Haramonas pauciplastida TaxID=478668 RepID=UPI002113CA71|nr:ribosomal protein S13 [Haramonas pauciplastida]UTE94962.1 ribosomal protein S13 [Haramonas pauciplastida]
MVRIQGVDLPANKKILYALLSIYGIGKTRSLEILRKANLSNDLKTSELDDDAIKRIRDILEKDYILEVNLRRYISLNINRLINCNCFRGQRHRNKLPVRGQRTRTNSRTRRINKKTRIIKK